MIVPMEMDVQLPEEDSSSIVPVAGGGPEDQNDSTQAADRAGRMLEPQTPAFLTGNFNAFHRTQDLSESQRHPASAAFPFQSSVSIGCQEKPRPSLIDLPQINMDIDPDSVIVHHSTEPFGSIPLGMGPYMPEVLEQPLPGFGLPNYGVNNNAVLVSGHMPRARRKYGGNDAVPVSTVDQATIDIAGLYRSHGGMIPQSEDITNNVNQILTGGLRSPYELQSESDVGYVEFPENLSATPVGDFLCATPAQNFFSPSPPGVIIRNAPPAVRLEPAFDSQIEMRFHAESGNRGMESTSGNVGFEALSAIRESSPSPLEERLGKNTLELSGISISGLVNQPIQSLSNISYQRALGHHWYDVGPYVPMAPELMTGNLLIVYNSLTAPPLLSLSPFSPHFRQWSASSSRNHAAATSSEASWALTPSSSGQSVGDPADARSHNEISPFRPTESVWDLRTGNYVNEESSRRPQTEEEKANAKIIRDSGGACDRCRTGKRKVRYVFV